MAHDKKYDPDWQAAKTHFSADLHAVVQTNDGPYAVGASGVVATSTDHGWVPIIHSGPSAQNSTLRDVAATGDGQRIWFAGASGALGMYDVKEQRKHDYSFPGDITDSWHAAAATGKAGKEHGLLANGSGSVVPFSVDGTDVKWGEPTKPGGGSAITDVALDPNGVAYATDTGGDVYRAKQGKSWTKIGIPDAQVSLNNIYVGKNNRVYVAADSGRLYRYDADAQKWTPIDIAETPLRAVDVHKEHIVVLADDNTFYWRTLGGDTRWQKMTAPTGNDLLGLALGYPDAAVGKAGTVVVRPPFEPPKEEKKEKHKHKDPKKKKQKEPHPDPCPIILEELIERLETEKLIELLEVKGCYTSLVEQIKTTEETEITELLEGAELIPLLLAEGEEHRHTGVRERREAETEYVRVPREELHTHEHRTKTTHAEPELEAEQIDIEALKRLLKC